MVGRALQIASGVAIASLLSWGTACGGLDAYVEPVETGLVDSEGPTVATDDTDVPGDGPSGSHNQDTDDHLPGDTGAGGSEPVDTAGEESEEPAGPVAPTITAVSTTEGAGMIVVAVDVVDPDGDLEGGVLTVSADGVAIDYAIPDDLVTWDPAGTATVAFPFLDCDRGASYEYEATATDAAGLTGNTGLATHTLSGFGAWVSEAGNTPVSSVPLGAVSTPAYICGHMALASHGATYNGDLDYFDLELPGGNLTFALTWTEPSGDYDLYMMDPAGAIVAQSIVYGTVQPESFNKSVGAASPWTFMVGGWDGGAGDWMLTIQ